MSTTTQNQIPTWRVALTLAALFLSSMCTMGDLVINPIVASIYDVFSDSPTWLINLGVTGPALVGLPFGLLAGFLCDRYDKKTIMVLGFLIFTFAAVFGVVYENIYYFVALRLCATGIGWGITNIAAFAILTEICSNRRERDRYVGWYIAAMSIVGAFMAAYSGMLAAGGWTHAFNTYLFAVPVLLMLIMFLPNFPGRLSKGFPVDEPAGTLDWILFNVEVPEEEAAGWRDHIVLLGVQAFFTAALYFCILYMLGLYLADVNLGGEKFVGLATSVMTCATAVGALMFGLVRSKLNDAVCLPAMVVIAGAFFVLANTSDSTMVLVTLAVAGFAWPYCYCFFYTHCADIAPTGKRGISTSIVAVAIGLAATVSSFIVTGGMAIIGSGCASVYPYLGMAMTLVVIVSGASWFIRNRP